jgi:hypothetical protein
MVFLIFLAVKNKISIKLIIIPDDKVLKPHESRFISKLNFPYP